VLRKIYIFISLFLLVIIQVSVLPVFFNSRRIPDLVLIVLIFLAARRGFSAVWGIAIVAGLLMDLLSFFPIGADIISFALVVFIVGFLAQHFFVAQSTWKFFVLIALIFIGTIANDLILSVLMKIFLNINKISSTGFATLSSDLWLKVLNNIVGFVIIYWPLKKFEDMKSFFAGGQHMFVRRPQ
jgi:rod shape-determining protein MreD